jgi:hypothetical protein
MDAFQLADRFQGSVAREWPDKVQEPSDLFDYFADWAEEITQENGETRDLISVTGGDYTMGLQTWIIVQARFAQYPEEFAAIRDFVTVPLNLRHGTTRLPGILDPIEWQRRLSAKLDA